MSLPPGFVLLSPSGFRLLSVTVGSFLKIRFFATVYIPISAKIDMNAMRMGKKTFFRKILF